MLKENYFILTGAMGAGKSTVLNKLKELNYKCVDEPAREILSEQRLIEGNGVPETDPELFTELMLSRTVYQYKKHSLNPDIVFFDRAMPDFTGYADLFEINNEVFRNASSEYRFNKNVFMFNGWRRIYKTDDERKMNFEDADKFGIMVKKIYIKSGYIIHEVPFSEVDKRVEFILYTSRKVQNT
jgi:predicted ATPase